MKRSMRFAIVAFLAILAGPGAGWAVSLPVASTAGDLCAPAANPCTVIKKYAVNDGTNFDIGGRDFVMAKSGGFVVSNGGSVTIGDTHSVSLQQGSTISSTVTGGSGGTITIDSDGLCTLAGKIIANGGDGGTVTVSCSDITLGKSGQVQATATNGSGGTVTLSASGTLWTSVNATLDVSGGGGPGSGGGITLIAGGATTIGGKLTSTGGCGGNIDVEGWGRLTVNAALNVTGSDPGCNGGGITLKAGGDTTIGAKLTAEGAYLSNMGGDGGNIDVEGCGRLTVNAPLNVSGGGGPGSGGNITLKAGGDTTIGAKLTSEGGCGGTIDVEGSGPLTVNRALDVNGSEPSCNGGNITLKADGDTTIGATLTSKGGDGGNISAYACGDLTISARGALNANACSGCFFGSGGTNDLTAAGGNLTISGPVVAGTNTFVYRTKTTWAPSLVNPTASETSGAAPCE